MSFSHVLLLERGFLSAWWTSIKLLSAENDILFKSSPGIHAAVLPDKPRFTLVAVSRGFANAWGINGDTLSGKGLFDVIMCGRAGKTSRERRDLMSSLRHVIMRRSPHSLSPFRRTVHHVDGTATEAYWRVNNVPVFNSKGDLTYIIISYEDLTCQVSARKLEMGLSELERSGRLLRESEARFRTMANSIPQLAWITDANGWIYWYNRQWYEYTGTTPAEMMGWGWRKVHHPDLVDGVVHRYREAIEHGATWEDTFLLRGRNGVYRWFLSRSVPVRGEDGRLIGWFGTNTDITDQRAIEDDLKKSEEQLLLALEGGELGFYDFDVRTGRLEWSARARELFGLPPDAPIDYGRSLQAIHPDDRQRTHELVQNALHNSKDGRYENTYRVVGIRDGKQRWLRSKGKVFFDEAGNAYRLAGVMLDITKQKETEEALQQSEHNLRNLVLQAPLAMCIGSGPSFVVEAANARMVEIWGKSGQEIIGRPVFDILTEAGEQGLKQVIERIYATGQRFVANEMPVLLPRNGKVETVYVNFVYEPIKSNGSVTKIVAVAVDVTDQVVARKKIETSHKEFQFLIDFVPQIIWLTRPDGYHYYFNQQWYDYTGLTYEETKGEKWSEVFHPVDMERAWEKWKHCLATGEPYEVEYRCRRRDGQYRWLLGRALPLRDRAGNIIKWFGTCTDIHDQKTFAEQLEKQVNERTSELQRSNEDLQQFVHVASHDLKEPVRKINVFVDRLQQESNDCLTGRGLFYVERVKAAAERMSAMLKGVLAYSTVETLEDIYEPVDLNAVLNEVELDLEIPIRQKAAIIRSSGLPRLSGAPAMLHQVFYNLISNALKFSRAGVPPVISISSGIVQKDGSPFARIRVADNGIGFAQKFAQKIFGTFTRLHPKDKYEGVGLGLSLCRKIIERHGGSITARSEEKSGSEFEILLPLEREGVAVHQNH